MPRKPEGASEGYMKKITVSGIGCNPGVAKNAPGPVPICRIYGFASGLHSEPYKKDDPLGDKWTCLVGEFVAVNLQDPDLSEYQAAWLFLPAGIQDVVQVALEKVIKDGKGGSVIFALELQAVPAKNPAGYSWRAVNLRPMVNQDNPLTKLRLEIEAAVPKALPAPAAAQKKGR